MELQQEAILKIKIADNITNQFDCKNTGNGLKTVVEKIPSLFPYPESVSANCYFENVLYTSKTPTRESLLFENEFLISENNKLQCKIFVDKMKQKNDSSFEISLIKLIFKNIAKQIASEYEIRDLSHSFNQVFDNSPDEMFIHDPSGKILNINEATCRKLGYSKEEMLMKTPAHFDAEEYKKLVPQRMKQVIKEGKGRFESIQITKSGKMIPVEINAVVGIIHGKPAIFSIVRDISESKKKEKQLLKAYNLLNNVVKNRQSQFLGNRSGKQESWI